MMGYNGLQVFYGDIHNHCNISYGHGSIEEAFRNARQRLDFCSATGHADWPDMAPPNPRIAHIIDFHKVGFSRLRKNWPDVQRITRKANKENEFLTFLSYEIHSTEFGDYSIVCKDFSRAITYAKGIPELKKKLLKLREQGQDTIAFPHHIGYLRGFRGMNWDVFSGDFSPVIEMISMHGCAEASDNPNPYVFILGPSDWQSTMQYGLSIGKVFGIVGNTDHHSAHPGSYGHGMTGVWAKSLTRSQVWEAYYSRRTYALTGDKMKLWFSMNDAPMGSIIPSEKPKSIAVSIIGGGIIDYVDVIKDNKVLRRFSQIDMA